jgi:hypothetical protein
MKWNGIYFYEVPKGTQATLRQYYRTGTGNGTTNPTADLRSPELVTLTEGADVIPMDQVTGCVIAALFEPDMSESNSYNTSVAQSLSGVEGLALVFHDFNTRNYPYYRLEANNPRDVLVDPADKECSHKECLKKICEKADKVIDKILDETGCNAGFMLFAFALLIPFMRKK